MNRLPDAEPVFAALNAFYDPLIERGVSRAPVGQEFAHEPKPGDEILEAA
jgi:hypothetical protein